MQQIGKRRLQGRLEGIVFLFIYVLLAHYFVSGNITLTDGDCFKVLHLKVQ